MDVSGDFLYVWKVGRLVDIFMFAGREEKKGVGGKYRKSERSYEVPKPNMPPQHFPRWYIPFRLRF